MGWWPEPGTPEFSVGDTRSRWAERHPSIRALQIHESQLLAGPEQVCCAEVQCTSPYFAGWLRPFAHGLSP